jgi:hypothetical protein
LELGLYKCVVLTSLKLNDLVGFIIALVAAIVSTLPRDMHTHILISTRSPRERILPRHSRSAGNEFSC